MLTTVVPLIARCSDCHLELASGNATRVMRAAKTHIDSYVKSFGERHMVLLVAKPDELLTEAHSAEPQRVSH